MYAEIEHGLNGACGFVPEPEQVVHVPAAALAVGSGLVSFIKSSIAIVVSFYASMVALAWLDGGRTL